MKNLNEEKNGLRMYELNCLIGLRHTDKLKEIARKIEAWVEKKKGEMAEIEKKETEEAKGGKSRIWIEKKRLAYPVQRDNFGYYLTSLVWLKPEELNDLKRFLKLEKEIVRFFILVRENASAPAPLRDAVTLSNAAQLEERKPERRAPYERYERKTVEPVRPVVVPQPKPKVEIKPEVVIVPEPETKAKPEPEEKPAGRPKKKAVAKGAKEETKPEAKKEKAAKHKKITLEELDQRLDDILNEDIL